jgi:hypothetical protein
MGSRRLLAAGLFLVSCFAYFSTLKIEVICSSETYVDFYRAIWRCIPEDRTLQFTQRSHHVTAQFIFRFSMLAS